VSSRTLLTVLLRAAGVCFLLWSLSAAVPVIALLVTERWTWEPYVIAAVGTPLVFGALLLVASPWLARRFADEPPGAPSGQPIDGDSLWRLARYVVGLYALLSALEPAAWAVGRWVWPPRESHPWVDVPLRPGGVEPWIRATLYAVFGLVLLVGPRRLLSLAPGRRSAD
jgi:hypothetical protein